MIDNAIIQLRNVCLSYNGQQVLNNLSMDVASGQLTAITGPSGSGKSTLLTLFNCLWRENPGVSVSGDIVLNLNGVQHNLLSPKVELETLRRQVGMVFQTPNPLPMSIFRNVAFPLKLSGVKDQQQINHQVEQSLKHVHLWAEVKQRLNQDARQLSGGQQQRLCIARSLILNPHILLLDEPTSSLDSAATERIEELLSELKQHCTLILVSHDNQQVKRLADYEYRLHNGSQIECDNQLLGTDTRIVHEVVVR